MFKKAWWHNIHLRGRGFEMISVSQSWRRCRLKVVALVTLQVEGTDTATGNCGILERISEHFESRYLRSNGVTKLTLFYFILNFNFCEWFYTETTYSSGTFHWREQIIFIIFFVREKVNTILVDCTNLQFANEHTVCLHKRQKICIS